MTLTALPPQLTYRDREFLKAVAAGRVQLTCNAEPDVYVDGLAWCDPFGARALIGMGLIERAPVGRHGERITALLTVEGGRRLKSSFR
ncbi:hypothetical protein SAMN05421630_103186 [Prauserella marina]|uniref:Uncharacterized protein n=1 Tax=Prauserella marina TaxID=530584 RepID=A0A1G6NKK4_9PSEU|nr:hypothetical protein [Prauserella marina]PWV82409.1 hypothetical protein DES30_102650 [Prauserella marina]SDC68470.1 hypothetical protein SAMN05421630_103186 [Prauserella marina]